MNDESYMDSDEIEEMPDESVTDMVDLLEHIQRQLTFLEKKVDLLLSRSEGERSFEGSRPFPRSFRKPYDKPPQRFDRPPRPPGRSRNDGDDRERGFRERESARDNYSDRRRAGKKPGGRPGGKPGGKPRSASGKKPFYSRYKD